MMEKVYICPTDKRHKCPWEGDMNGIYDHFIDSHEDLLRHTNEIDFDLLIKSENILILFDEEIYLVQHKIDDDILYIKLRFLGLHELASRITYYIGFEDNPQDIKDHLCVISRNGGWEVDLKQIKNTGANIESLSCRFTITKSFLEEESVPSKESSDSDTPTITEEKETKKIKKNHSYTMGSRKTTGKGLSRSIRHKSVIIVRDRKAVNRLSSEIADLNQALIKDQPDSEKNCIPPENFTESDLACSTCEKVMLPPIYFCDNNHSVCSNCKQNPCKICESTITDNRNDQLESISRNFLYSCRYGCEEKFRYNEIRDHEIKCIFCTYSCPIKECPVTGTMSIFHNHISLFHREIKVHTSLRNDFPKGSEFFIVNPDKGIFYCICQEHLGIIEWQVIFCGPYERQFFCEMYFKNSKNKDRVYFKKNKEKYAMRKSEYELKQMKVKEKHAVLEITSYD